MRYTFGSVIRSRIFAIAILGAVLLGCILFLYRSMDSAKFKSVNGLDIAGQWQFHNGSLENPLAAQFSEHVKVPDPLPDSIRTNLQKEFWYRTTFSIPQRLAGKELALSLGSVKGAHEVYWNGKFLGGGGSVGIGTYRIPPEYRNAQDVVLTVRVQRSRSLFPGIVHMAAVSIEEASIIERKNADYYFEIGVKPLLPAGFKLVLFFLFCLFFTAVPFKREYLSFSIFSLFSAASSAFYSRFLPGYEDIYFKNGMIFVFSALSLSMIPAMTGDFLRLKEEQRSGSRMYGYALGLIFIGASFFLKNPDHLINLYRMANTWLPLAALLPCIAFSFLQASRMDAGLRHRKIQIATFAFFLGLGALAWSSFTSSYLNFQKYSYPEFVDLFLFAGLGVTMGMDFRFSSLRSERAGKVLPKWFAGFLAGSTERVTMEIPLVVLAVDTVGYTKKLSLAVGKERGELHDEMRALLAPLTEKYGGQKISERGDGGIFAWDMPLDSSLGSIGLAQALEAARYLTSIHEGQHHVHFRVGMACGMVRAELRAGDFSFLGEALNSAARLETLAEAGSALVDESLYERLGSAALDGSKIEAEVKGVVYHARPLKKSA